MFAFQKDTLSKCHPEPAFWAKDLRRRLIFQTPYPGFLPRLFGREPGDRD